ncbi:MAG: pilus assembly protein TadG-related protein [Pseudomonadota bacterium]
MKKFQSGGYLVLVSLLMVVLIGIGALALDLGRMFVVRSEIQNAVDSASLAAAAELDGSNGARDRAEDVATGLLNSTSAFTLQSDLLDGLVVEFYSDLGDPPGSARIAATDDSDARFVRVVIDQASVGLLFLPVLGGLLDNVSDQAFLSAAATAGRAGQPLVCDYAPIAWCGPFDTADVGDQIRRPTHGQGNTNVFHNSTWGFLEPPGGYTSLHDYLYSEEPSTQCVNPVSEFQPLSGSEPQIGHPLNTYFGLNDNPTSYPRDPELETGSGFAQGSGNWPGRNSPYATRLEWHEADNGGDAGRRSIVMPVSIGNCSQDVRGSSTFTPDGFARFFITEPVNEGPGNSGNSGNSGNRGNSGNSGTSSWPMIFAEFSAWEVAPPNNGTGSVSGGGEVRLYE